MAWEWPARGPAGFFFFFFFWNAAYTYALLAKKEKKKKSRRTHAILDLSLEHKLKCASGLWPLYPPLETECYVRIIAGSIYSTTHIHIMYIIYIQTDINFVLPANFQIISNLFVFAESLADGIFARIFILQCLLHHWTQDDKTVIR